MGGMSLSQGGMTPHQIRQSVKPFRPHVEASPRGFSSLPAPGEQELVSEVGAVPASGATPSHHDDQALQPGGFDKRGTSEPDGGIGVAPTGRVMSPSGVDDAGTRSVTPLVDHSQERGEGDSEEGGVDRTGNLQREANRARCHDAIHTYLVELCGYDQAAVMPTFLKAVSAVEALADSLAARQAEEGK